MAESAHFQQLGKFVVLFQELENSLIEFISVIADEDYAVEILPAETEYPRLVESADVIFSRLVDRLRRPDLETKTRFHKLMEKCLDIGVLRNRLIRSTYALLVRTGEVAALVQEEAKLKFKGGSRRQVIGEALSVESFEPYFQQIAEVLAELESFRLQAIEWKNSGV
jgi:hypothetical protein